MKHLITAFAALLLLGSAAFAGGLAAPVVEMAPEIIIDQTPGGSSSAGLIIPLILIALIAAALSSGGNETVSPSDQRFKTDILQTGTSPSGLPIYSYKYIGGATTYQGVMAQDVLMHSPEAVIIGPLGYMAVDYSQIDVTMRVLN